MVEPHKLSTGKLLLSQGGGKPTYGGTETNTHMFIVSQLQLSFVWLTLS